MPRTGSTKSTPHLASGRPPTVAAKTGDAAQHRLDDRAAVRLRPQRRNEQNPGLAEEVIDVLSRREQGDIRQLP